MPSPITAHFDFLPHLILKITDQGPMGGELHLISGHTLGTVRAGAIDWPVNRTGFVDVPDAAATALGLNVTAIRADMPDIPRTLIHLPSGIALVWPATQPSQLPTIANDGIPTLIPRFGHAHAVLCAQPGASANDAERIWQADQTIWIRCAGHTGAGHGHFNHKATIFACVAIPTRAALRHERLAHAIGPCALGAALRWTAALPAGRALQPSHATPRAALATCNGLLRAILSAGLGHRHGLADKVAIATATASVVIAIRVADVAAIARRLANTDIAAALRVAGVAATLHTSHPTAGYLKLAARFADRPRRTTGAGRIVADRAGGVLAQHIIAIYPVALVAAAATADVGDALATVVSGIRRWRGLSCDWLGVGGKHQHEADRRCEFSPLGHVDEGSADDGREG